MHVYIYDNYVNDRKFDNAIAKIETRITDLGLNGKIVRLGVMSSILATVENQLKQGVKTIVVVGNNYLFHQTINALASLSNNYGQATEIPLGFIPVGKKNNQIADALNIPLGEAACDIISARLLEKFDLGSANHLFFLTQAAVSTINTIIEIDANYTIEIKDPGEISIVSLPLKTASIEGKKINPHDNVLDLLISEGPYHRRLPLGKKGTNKSVFAFCKLRIVTQNNIIIDLVEELKSPVDISIAKEQVNLIIGKK
jgi:hypothetical protein